MVFFASEALRGKPMARHRLYVGGIVMARHDDLVSYPCHPSANPKKVLGHVVKYPK
jgi:hypothetical protein